MASKMDRGLDEIIAETVSCQPEALASPGATMLTI
jgi:hypothetical protein